MYVHWILVNTWTSLPPHGPSPLSRCPAAPSYHWGPCGISLGLPRPCEGAARAVGISWPCSPLPGQPELLPSPSSGHCSLCQAEAPLSGLPGERQDPQGGLLAGATGQHPALQRQSASRRGRRLRWVRLGWPHGPTRQSSHQLLWLEGGAGRAQTETPPITISFWLVSGCCCVVRHQPPARSLYTRVCI